MLHFCSMQIRSSTLEVGEIWDLEESRAGLETFSAVHERFNWMRGVTCLIECCR